MYPSLSTRRRLLLALLILGGKSTYSIIKSFLPAGRQDLPIGYSGPKFYGMLKRLEKEGLIRRDNKSQTFARQQKSDFCRTVRLLPAGIGLLERRYGQRLNLIRNLLGVPASPAGGRQGESLKDLKENWSLIILNFPTSQAYSRSRLAGRLLELGCRPLRDGVYLNPYPILDAVAEWAEENNCLDRIFSLSFSLQPSAFSIYLSACDLPAFSRRYLSLLDRLNISKGVSLPRKRDRAFARIKSDFLDLVVRDPLLPQALLPADYPLARVIGEITNLDKDISSDIINIDNF